MKRIIVFFTLALLLLLSACAPKGEFHYNKMSDFAQGAPPYIEGAYTKEITKQEFDSLSGVALPEYQAGEHWANYDGEDEILNLQVNAQIGEDVTYIALHSKSLWSERSYSPVDYVYDGSSKVTDIEGVEARIGYCKGNRYDLDTDIYTAAFAVGEIGVDVEVKTNDRAIFETFIKQLILNNK